MRKLAVLMALASTAIASPALARDNAWYVGVEGGAMIVEDLDFDVTATNGTTTGSGLTVDHDYGYDVDGVIGYDFGAFRLEAEVGYRRASVKSVTSSVTLPAFTSTGGIANQPSGRYPLAGGLTSALSFMVNGLLDFGDDDGLQGFIGGGAGIARVKTKYGLSTAGRFLNDSDTVFAFQGLAGIRAPLTDTIDATLKYRFFNADDVTVVDVSNRQHEGRFRSHSILGGLAINFGEPAPEPVPEAAPLPPEPTPQPVPQPVAQPCVPGPFIVFFEWDKSDITPEAASILDNAVQQYTNCGAAQVQIAGHADKSGSARYNVGLSQRRADAVRGYLGSRSIPEGSIATQAFGEERPRVDTADGVREVQNRRVEVLYGPGAGQ